MKKRFTSEMGLLLFMAFFSVVFFAGSFFIPPLSAAFPRFISLATLIISVQMFIARLRSAPEAKTQEAPKTAKKLNWIVLSLLMFVFLGLIYVFGMAISTFVFLAAMPYLLNYRKPIPIIIFAFVFTAVLMSAMKWVFLTPIPGGILFG